MSPAGHGPDRSVSASVIDRSNFSLFPVNFQMTQVSAANTLKLAGSPALPSGSARITPISSGKSPAGSDRTPPLYGTAVVSFSEAKTRTAAPNMFKDAVGFRVDSCLPIPVEEIPAGSDSVGGPIPADP